MDAATPGSFLRQATQAIAAAILKSRTRTKILNVETANPKRGSICSIGVAVVRGGVRVATHTWLCRPPAPIGEFSPYNVRVHKITPADVAGQPGFAQRLPEVLAVIDGLPVVAHNAAFDMDNLTRACSFTGADLPDWMYGCTYAWSKRQLSLEKYRLPYVAGALGVTLDDHHHAGADAARPISRSNSRPSPARTASPTWPPPMAVSSNGSAGHATGRADE